ncbi:MAG: histidinol-phosphatase [Deltaproteobacteria bacterium]|nr:histidinol-phosphatase [Deltaproteobacteria bacterium]MBW2361841.1 histidinol-phosphatase [Deltaproteobacteria bacterium]
MPWFSYHGGHSGQFSCHAKDRLEEIVLRAIELGFTHYGLSEHCPRYSAEVLFPEELELGVEGLQRLFRDYVVEARELQERYADRIEILIGYETENLPLQNWKSVMRGLREEHHFDYCVGSVHHLDTQWVDFSKEEQCSLAEARGGREQMQADYFDAVAELVDALRPEVVGHIDLVRKFDGADARFSPQVFAHIERALESVAAAGSRLDVNSGAFRKGLSPVYPLPEILVRAREMGIGVTLGDDGHGVATVGVGLDEAMRVIAAAGYAAVDHLSRRDGEVQWVSASIDTVAPKP